MFRPSEKTEPTTLLATPFSRRSIVSAGLLGATAAVASALETAPTAFADTASDLKAAQSKLAAVQKQLDAISDEYVAMSKKQAETISKIEKVQQAIGKTEQEIEETVKRLKDKQQVLAKRIDANYKAGNESFLGLLLSSTTFEELVSNIYYMDKISASDRQVIDEVKGIKADLDKKKEGLENDEAELEKLNNEQTAQLNDMLKKQQETQEIIDGLSDDVKALMAKRDKELAEAAAAAAAAQRARTAAASGFTRPPRLPEVGGGQDFKSASAAQQNIVRACHYVPSPGNGYCAMWVSQVYYAAGQPYPGGDACDMYANWCRSSNKSDLKVGMIVAVSTHSHTIAGRIYGHVGIYIGGGQMMDNIGYIRTIGVDEWIAFYGTTVTPRWGWANGGLS